MILQNGLRLVFRGWRSILALTILISMGCFVFSLALADVFTQIAVLRGGRTLRAHDAVSFSTFYKEGAVSEPNPAALRILANELSAGRAYSAVIHNSNLSESASITGVPIVLMFGDVIPELYPDLHLCSPAPCAMRGVDVGGDTVPTLVFSGKRVPFSGVLPRRATWFDPNSTGIPLARNIVVRLSADDIRLLDRYAQEEMLSRTVMLRPPSTVVDEFVKEVRFSDVYLVPNSLAVDQPRRFREVVSRSAMYLAGFVAYLALMFGVMSASLNTLLERERSRFQIQRTSGATEKQINGSVAVFLAFSIMFLPVLATAPLLLIGESFAGAFRVVLVGCAGIWIVETLRAIRSLAGRDLARLS